MVRLANTLDLDVAEFQPADLLADACNVGFRLTALDLDDSTALEVDSDIQSNGEEEHEG
jgi:hypothetical protein